MGLIDLIKPKALVVEAHKEAVAVASGKQKTSMRKVNKEVDGSLNTNESFYQERNWYFRNYQNGSSYY